MTTYTDSDNYGNPNVLKDQSGGATFNIGLGCDWVTGTSNETLNLLPNAGYNGDVVAPNQYQFLGDYNTINLDGDNTWLWVYAIQASGTNNTINGLGNNNQYTPTLIPLLATTTVSS